MTPLGYPTKCLHRSASLNFYPVGLIPGREQLSLVLCELFGVAELNSYR